MSSEIKKVLFGGMVGNALEWYDFVLFVQFAPFIGPMFFPSNDPTAALISTLSLFAVGFVMRPLGGILFGYIGDEFGRRTSLVLSILLMSIPTALIGILPTYAQAGIWAPIGLAIIRLLQGLALGGGLSGCMTFMVEHAEQEKRGVIGSASMFSLGAGILLGILVTVFFANVMDRNSFETWGWRIPFIISIFIGLVAFYIRNHVHESPLYEKAKEHGKLSKAPVRDVFKHHLSSLIKATGIYLTVTVPFYTFSAFFNILMQTHLHYSLHDALLINGVAIAVFMLFIPIAGALSDKFGRRSILMLAAFTIATVSYPVFMIITKGGMVYPLAAECVFAIALALYMGPVPATLVELFPTSIRFTGLSLSYNISAALFGGTVPLVYSLIIEKTGDLSMPAPYIMFFALLSTICLYKYRDKHKLALVE